MILVLAVRASSRSRHCETVRRCVTRAGPAVLRVAALLLLGLYPGLATAAELRGGAQVHDGDTLVVAGEKVRLLDVDAPELAQRCDGPKELAACGKVAAEALEGKLAEGTVTCRGDERDDFGRLLMRCSLGGEDLSTWLVEQGWGLAFRRYSTKLVETEERAKADKRGLWRTVLEPPWAFRARRWAKAGSEAPGGCAIKGNISRKGERIYHTPWGDRFYERTRIDTSKGERWFCSEKEAADAGFRAPLLR